MKTMKKAMVAFAAIVALLVLVPAAPALAADTDGAVVIAPFDIGFIDVLRLFIIPVLLPALVGFVNRVTNWPAFVKRFALAFLALASNVALEFLSANDSGQPYNLWWALFLGVIAYAVAELTYQGFYKIPTSTKTIKMVQSSDGTWTAPTLASKIAGK